MKKLLLVIILVIAPSCFGQKIQQLRYVLKQQPPSVYITYVKTDERFIYDNKIPFAWFLFHNKTNRKIVLQAGGGIGENDARLFYDILDKENNIIKATYCHSCSIIRLSGGNSILFSLPLEYLKNSDSMRIDYKFDWEESPFKNDEEQPINYVYFKIPLALKNDKFEN